MRKLRRKDDEYLGERKRNVINITQGNMKVKW